MSELRLATPPSLTVIDPNELRVTRLRALRGPNYWRLAPVIACDVRLGALESVTSADVPGFNDRLLTALPSLREHPCSSGAPGGFVDRLEKGTHIPHILEHVALDLQNLASSDVGFGRVVESGDAGVWWVIVAYDEEDVGLQSMRDAVSLVRSALGGQAFDIDAAVRELQDLFERVRLGPSTWAIVEEARRRGIPVRRLNSRSLVQLGLGRNLRRIQATLTDHTSAIAIEIAQDKDDTKRVLEAIGLPVPHGNVAESADQAVEFAQEIGFPVILKPLDLSHGRGISARLTDEAAVRTAWDQSRQLAERFIVEQFAEGRDHRVLVIGGRVVAVAERVPAHVTGDGVHNVCELIDIANQDPRRGVGHTKVLTRLACDEITVEHLARSGRTLTSVPAKGEHVSLCATANLSTGGTSIDRTDDIHPSNVTACEMAAGVVGLDIAGIDVITRDISVPFRENGAAIIEVNAAPGVRMHTHPTEGEPRNIGAPIIDMLYPPGAPAAIPVVSVTGTNGKTTTVRLIAHIFRHTGKTVGFTTTDGVYLNNRLVIEGDMTGPFSANIILSNPTVDVAVLETARGGIIRAGLGFDECDAGVVLNVSADHLGLGGINTLEQLADVKSVIAAVVKREGHAVLNADDPLVLAMRDRSPGDVVLFSTTGGDDENPAITDHLAQAGIAVLVEQDTFVVRRGRLRIPIAAVREVPLMMGGAARFQRGNILAAIGTAYVQGIRYDDIRAGLLSFFPSPALTPGRLNLLRAGRGRLLVDYAHNAAAVAGLMELVASLDARRRVGVVTAPGDRRDEDIRELGRLSAGLDHVIVKEDDDRRGRESGEIAALVRAGLVAGGLSPDAIEVVADELEAVDRAVSLLGDHDIGVVLADDVRGVLSHLQRRAQPASVS
jgi:cyanophycin synthetase